MARRWKVPSVPSAMNGVYTAGWASSSAPPQSSAETLGPISRSIAQPSIIPIPSTPLTTSPLQIHSVPALSSPIQPPTVQIQPSTLQIRSSNMFGEQTPTPPSLPFSADIYTAALLPSSLPVQISSLPSSSIPFSTTNRQIYPFSLSPSSSAPSTMAAETLAAEDCSTANIKKKYIGYPNRNRPKYFSSVGSVLGQISVGSVPRN